MIAHEGALALSPRFNGDIYQGDRVLDDLAYRHADGLRQLFQPCVQLNGYIEVDTDAVPPLRRDHHGEP